MSQVKERPAAAKHDPDQDYAAFLARLSVKGRATAEKHDEQCGAAEAEGYGTLWKRLAGALARLSPHETEMAGANAAKFHIPDGKYRLQVFALEDSRKGTIAIYMPDVVENAIKRKILTADTAERTYKVVGGEDSIHLELITAQTQDMTVCKAMVGWGRRAMKLNVSVQSKEKQIRTVEQLCELAAEAWANAPVKAAE